ncbi:Mitochondrial ribosome-associated GTPase 1 [Babesia sp. Xinjiang]|uniref:Mitochondrial ribosome-associated GTPase 1 n=1 Tax=Babesia sp. Xinjiang TaxID=462227 RepID=UPI000A263AD1|nr:Mitochondrial ribosome-associated GTPase 1 [Babesia sp. Xinjiang]XP_028872080.1 Mitochondrial ribosome-associated GTPase 1 [Babesia sp. Xinjiang]ORM41543.1 Mitochondrial ribosome-associated GTPase 1 [Babesia sp. Xinjiang]ORM41624.1 Mitochondrial ribosome-associated GTPase 1 [Babesia sp. Xinjiang]
MNRVGRPSGPSLDDFIYRTPPQTFADNTTVFYHPAGSNAYEGTAKSASTPFTTRDRFTFDRSITWFPAHMASAKLNIGKKRRAVDCILEVRDARAPLTSSNCSLLEEYPDHVPRLVVLNKSDLVPASDIKRASKLLEQTGRHVVAYSALGLRKITQITNFVNTHVSPKFKTLGVWMMVVGLPNVGKSSIINALKRYSFSQRWHSRYGMHEPTRLTTAKARCSAEPGSTRHLGAFFVSEKPKLYCFDTPGVMLPKMECPEINLKLAALGCLEDHRAGLDYISDYILYTLNRRQLLDYVHVLGLERPTDDVKEVGNQPLRQYKIAQVMEHISHVAERKYSTIEPANCYRIFINQFRLGRFGRICMDDLSDIMRRGDLSDFELSIVIWRVILLVCALRLYHVYAFTPNTRTYFSALGKPYISLSEHHSSGFKSWKVRNHELPAIASTGSDPSGGQQRQYVEDGLIITEFEPLHKGASAPARSDPAFTEAVNHFHEVDCSEGADPLPREDDINSIDYEELQLAFYQGDEVVDVVLKNAQDMLNMECENLLQFHRCRRYAGLAKESSRNDAAAMRSIRCLVYLIGGRILNCAKKAMNRVEREHDGNSSATEGIRRNLEGRIRGIILETVNYWEGIIKPKKVECYLPVYPRVKEVVTGEEYVAKVWDYLNASAFGGDLPEYCDMNFGWYNMIEPDGSVIESSDDELFRISRREYVRFPRVVYPKELVGYQSALGNTVFRSMLKLYCDIYGSRFGGEDYASSALSALQFVESTAARNDRVAFSCIQSDVVGSDSRLRHLLSHLNALEPLRNAEGDINDDEDVFPDLDQLPYFKNRLSFRILKKVVKETQTALEIFDSSFRPHGKEWLDRVDEELKSGNIDITAGILVEPPGKLSSAQKVDMQSDSKSSDDMLEPREVVWSRDTNGNLTVPINELYRSLVFADLEKFGNLLSLGMNELLELKPVQINSIQNKIVALCINVLNQVRALDAFSVNFSLIPEDIAKQSTVGLVEKSNTVIIQCIMFLNKFIGRCLAHRGLYPLDNEFLRERPLELLIKENNPSMFTLPASIDPTRFGAAAVREEARMKPVPFPKEYMNDVVSADDPSALQFLVNYYNFNLFGGRLPIDLAVKFDDEALNEYLSSHDDSAESLIVPTIRLNPLVKRSKILVSRLVMDECFHLYLRNSYRFNTSFEGKSKLMLTDVLDSDIVRRTRQHLANCIEPSGGWPFFFDELEYMAINERPELANLGSRLPALKGRSLNTIFSDLISTDLDVVGTLEKLVERTDMSDLWERQVLPIRHFVNSLQSGIYDLAYTVILNPSSVAVISPMPISEINMLENKFKEACHISHVLDDGDGKVVDESRQHLNSLANLESLKIVECAFDELREHSTKHGLISVPDLTEGIREATDNLARCQPEELAHQPSEVDCTIIGTSPSGLPTELRRSNKDEEVIKKYMPVTDPPTSKCTPEGNVDSSSNNYTLNEEERLVFAEAVYSGYNHTLFKDALPSDVGIEFTSSLDDLSSLYEDLHHIAPPIIRLHGLLFNAKLIFLQMMLQMINISFASSTHNIEMDCLRYFGTPYRSAFARFHSEQQQLIKSRLLPLSREARQKAKEESKDGVNETYISSLKDAADVKAAGGSGNTLLDMEIDEFVDEVLEGRSKVQRLNTDVSLCNPFEEYQTLKSFARHFVNWKRTKSNYQGAASVEPVPFSSSGDKALPILSNSILRTLWSRSKFEHVEKLLKQMGMEMPLSANMELNWQRLLTEDQQFKLMKYLTLKAVHYDSAFTMLVRSGACTPEESCELMVKLTDPYLKLEPYPDDNTDTAASQEQRETPRTDTQDATASADEPEQGDVFSNETFVQELEGVTKSMDPSTAETVNVLVDKLVRRNYSAALGILSSHPKQGYLKESAMKLLDIIRNNGVLDDRQHIEILEFLRN